MKPIPFFRSDDAGASTVANDVVTSQTQDVYDGDGNPIETIESDRLPSAGSTATGALGDASGDGGPAASVSSDAMYYDDADRETAEENVGTNGGTAWTRPSTPDASDVTHLVTTTEYGPQGLASLTIDPRGIKDLTVYNMLGQTIQTIAAYTGTSSADLNANAGVTDAAPTADTNQTTDLTYDGDGNETSMTAVMPSGQPSQTTDYLFGVSPSTGSAVSSNDLLDKTEYPDATTGAASGSASDDVTDTYDALGETTSTTDQNDTTHTYTLDALGRQTADTVTLPTGNPENIDTSVMARTTTYDQQGNPSVMSSLDGSGAVVNQVQDSYNGLGQLTAESQSVSGAVSDSTPQVQYGYADPSAGSLLSSMTYPNGRELDYGYDGNAIDQAVGRVDSVSDAAGTYAGTPIVTYTYLGDTTIIGQTDGNGVALTTTLNPFDQVAETNWQNANTPTPTPVDDFAYGYDQAGNVLYSDNLVNPSQSELYHPNSTTAGDDNTAYDPLDRLTGFERGAPSASDNNGGTLDTVSSPSETKDYTLDAVGNQTAVTTNGTTVDNTANSKNQLTGNGSAALVYDNDGNTLTDQSGKQYVYNAWNQIVTVKNSSGTTLETFGYDALGRRIVIINSGTATDVYYSNLGQVLEERQGGTVTAQYVWGTDYVNDLVLRDDNSTSGSLGTSGSGLGERLYAQHDANFNVTSLTDSTGTVVERFEYDPYGSVTVLSPSWSTTSDGYNWLYLFQGMRYDPVTGLFETPNRDLNPATGTWMEADPDGYINGPNIYQAEVGSPVGYLDPMGTDVYVPRHDTILLPDGRIQLIIHIYLFKDQRWSWLLGNGDQEQISVLRRSFTLDKCSPVYGRLVSLYGDMAQGLNNGLAVDDVIKAEEQSIQILEQAAITAVTAGAIAPEVTEAADAVDAATDADTAANAVGDADAATGPGAAGEDAAADAGATESNSPNGTCFMAGTLVCGGAGQLRRIDSLRPGQRVATSPDSASGGPSLNPSLYRLIHLELVQHGRQMLLSYLRPAAVVDGLGPGDTVAIELMEVEARGRARVLGVEPCPPLEDGPGHLITAVFSSDGIDLRQLRLVGMAEPIEVTGNHPVYSHDRGDFVLVSNLKRGELLRTRTGTIAVESATPVPGRYRVYNIEVGSVHQYYVSDRLVLVHNMNSGKVTGDGGEGPTEPPSGPTEPAGSSGPGEPDQPDELSKLKDAIDQNKRNIQWLRDLIKDGREWDDGTSPDYTEVVDSVEKSLEREIAKEESLLDANLRQIWNIIKPG